MLFHSVLACFAFRAYAIGVEPACPTGTCSTGSQQASLLQHRQNVVKEEQELTADEPDDLPKTSEDKYSAENVTEEDSNEASYSIGPDEHGYIAKAREDVARELATVVDLKEGEGSHLLQGLDPGPQEAPAKTSHLNSSLLQTELGPPPLGREGCRNSPENWHDSDGPRYDCGWYARTNRACQSYGGGYRNFGKTAKQACCACGGGTKKQQYYAFSHRTLTTDDVAQALADGVNAIEIDVTAWWNECNQHDWRTGGCWWAQHDGQCNIGGGDLDCDGGRSAAGARLDVMLKKIRDEGAGKIGAVMIDIKNPDFCDPASSYYKQCSVVMLKDLVESILGTRVNVVYDVYGQFSGRGYKWLQKNHRPCYDSTDAELGTSGYSFPYDMAKTYTYGGSFGFHPISSWCEQLEKTFLAQSARVAAFWTTTQPSQVILRCGNAIVLGHTLFHYSKGGSSFKNVVNKAKQVAAQRGFEWATSATSWCT